MRNSISSYKESLSRLANEVLDADDELDGHPSRSPSADDAASTGRRNSWRFSHSRSPTVSPIPNGTSSVSPDEIAQYKADIQKLQASEAEIKALSFNYASMLKDKEEQLSRLRGENSSLKIILAEKDAGEHVLREGSSRTLSNSSKMTKGITDMSPSRFHKNTSKGSFSKHDGLNNGNAQFSQLNGFERKNDQRIAISAETEKEQPEMLAENSRSLGHAGTNLESEVEELKAQLHKEHDDFEKLKIRLQEEHQLNESFYKELHDLKLDKEKVSNQVNELQKELSEKLSELRCLQIELDGSNKEKEQGEATESLKKEIERLKKKNTILKVEKDELNANMQQFKNSLQGKADAYGSDHSNHLPQLDKVKEEMDLQIQQLEKSLNNTCKERDKALQELARLKQHLLDQELEESNKMDEDNKIIEELRSKVEYQRAQTVQLEKALKQEMAKKEEILRAKNEEFHKLSELNNALSQKVETCMNTIEAKNVELLNLQTVLGQYYAESEAKERIGRDLSLMKEESAKLSQMVKVAKEEQEILRREKADTISRLSQAERLLLESKHSITKLEEENSKLRRALEQSMTTLNRMSLDSDNYVDRRIVIKLLVTYFQRNHSKEVLDLMVRMLGFSEEEKQRIGFAQQVAGKGVVRGVLGLPGRLVGGILGGSSQEAHSQVPSENQSFADLWVDFLLKETEERERRESAEAARMSSSTEGSTAARQPSVPESRASMLAPTSDLPSIHPSGSRFSASVASNNKNRLFEPSEGEFATVPLTSSQAPLSKSGSKFPRQIGY